MPGTAPVVDQVRSLFRTRRERLAARFQWIRLALETMQADRHMAGSVMAAGVAFRLFLMILPVALLIAAIVGFAQGEVSRSPGVVAGQYGLTFAIAQIIASSARQASGGRWILLATGVALLLWTGNGVVQALSSAFRVAWNIERAQTSPLKGLIVIAGLVLAVTATAATAAIGAGSPALELPITAGLAVGYAGIWLVIPSSFRMSHAPGRRWFPGRSSWRSGLPRPILVLSCSLPTVSPAQRSCTARSALYRR